MIGPVAAPSDHVAKAGAADYRPDRPLRHAPAEALDELGTERVFAGHQSQILKHTTKSWPDLTEILSAIF